MRFDRLDLNLLIALDVLLDLRSVSASARRLNLSQPAISGALNRLRDYFQDSLLFQSGRQMLLTPRAEELKGPVRRALLQIRAEITLPAHFDPSTASRRFSIIASDYAFTILLARVIAQASVIAPGVSFEVISPGERAAERLDRAEVDLALTVTPFSFPQHPIQELWRDEEVVVSWTGAEYEDIDNDVFMEAGHAVAIFGSDGRLGLTERMLSDIGIDRRIEILLPSFTALPQAIIGTRRLATMHKLYALHFSRIYPIRLHPFPGELPPVVEVMQWHHARSSDQGISWLRELLEQTARQICAEPEGPEGR